ncbi:hypothetical protein [Rhodococcus sp. HNM0569]|uniref:hypothetical protein n=1 Tax=Rhodococcus sp. HNM0569 TaxID=2716340 RepID=UPI00146BF732|nr:hypothetical protein [Rhodococcus sp. HNM0569]NLU84642.1 hypothetical protein [Rhodococcus sp. HNM0569]
MRSVRHALAPQASSILTAVGAPVRAVVDLRHPSPRRVAAAVLSGAVGLVAWFVVFLAVVAATRGVLYGVVDKGPYDTAWGGPTLAGAWAVHLALGLLAVPVAAWLLAWIGTLVAALRDRIVRRRGSVLIVPTGIVVAAFGVILVVSWLHQLD